MNILKTITLFIRQNKHLLIAFLVLFLITIPTIPSYYFGEEVMFQNHDHIFHIFRLWHIEKAFKEGIVMPNWIGSMTYGLGSPIFLLSWFLPNYLGLPLRWIGLSLADTLKLLYLISYLASGITIYLLARKLTNKTTALASIPFYLLAPFRLNLIFTRGGFGASWSQVLYPLVMLFSISQSRFSLFFLTLVLSLLSLSHNLSFVFALGLLLIWTLISQNQQIRKKNIKAILLSLIITSFFWLPAFIEREFTHYQEMARNFYQDQFPSFMALINSAWQYGPPQPERQHLSMSFQIGKIHWIIIGISPLLIFFKKKLNSIQKRIVLLLFLLFWGTIFFQIKASKPIWDNIDVLKLFIFPWRIQALSVLAVSLLASFVVFILPKKNIIVISLIALLLIANRNHFYTARGNYASDQYIKNLGHSGGSWGEFLPIWADLEEYRSFRKQEILPLDGIVKPNKDIIVLEKNIKETMIGLTLEADKETQVIVNHYYFPGWKGYLDGKKLVINNNLELTKGRQNFILPAGRHEILLRFEKTLIRKITSIVSLIGMSIYLVFLSLRLKNKS